MNQAGDFSPRRLVLIGGVPVDNLTMLEALDRIETFIDSRRPHQIATANVDFIVKAQDDPELMHILQEADLITADGMPVVWGSRLLKAPLKERVAGSDLVPLLAERGAQKGWRFYFIGAAPGVAAGAAEILSSRYTGLKVVGAVSPPNTSVVEMPLEFVHQVRAACPDILLVAFGNPKQEKWIHMHLRSLDVPVAMGVGGTLDFITGTQRRAPAWMQAIGAEWIHRLLQDPKRMWRRYATGLFRFAKIFGRQWWRQVRGKIYRIIALPGSDQAINKDDLDISENQEMRLIQPYSLTKVQYASLFAHAQSLLQYARSQGERPRLVYNMLAVKHIDTAGLGMLIEITRLAREAGGDLILEDVQPSIRKIFSELKLDRFFTLDGSHLPGEFSCRLSEREGSGNYAGWKVLTLPSRVDVESVEQLRIEIDFKAFDGENLILDLSRSDYIDSAGIAWLSETSQRLHSQGSRVQVLGLKHEVLHFLKFSGYGHNILSGELTYHTGSKKSHIPMTG